MVRTNEANGDLSIIIVNEHRPVFRGICVFEREPLLPKVAGSHWYVLATNAILFETESLEANKPPGATALSTATQLRAHP